jgi:branched-subunit amino acid transport protein AzlD
MIEDTGYVVSVILVMSVVTVALRALPFVASQWLLKHALVQRLGQFLPLAIMTLLLVHSVAGASIEHQLGPWPELLAVALVMLFQWWGKNALLSIILGTAVYVLIRNIHLL